jgi:hypothetical protein
VNSQTATTEQVQELEKLNLPCKCRIRGHQLTAGGTQRTFRYFVIQNPSESKKDLFPVPHSVLSFLAHPTFCNPYLSKVTNPLGSTLRRSRHSLDISRTLEITVSVFHHNLKCLNLGFC